MTIFLFELSYVWGVLVFRDILKHVWVKSNQRLFEVKVMKKKLVITAALITIAIVVVFAIALNKPYKPVSFVADGDNFSATVENGGTLLLDLKNDNKHIEWLITQSPECYACDYSTVSESGTEFHIIALNHGEGVMKFQCLFDDGNVEQYELTLSISRHQKIYLQIDSVSFVRIIE